MQRGAKGWRFEITREGHAALHREDFVREHTRVERFTHKARQEPQARFNALMGLLFDPEGLRESFERQDGNKAPGVDGIRKAQYGEGLDERGGSVGADTPAELPAQTGEAEVYPERGRTLPPARDTEL
jgi:hypothetical protein